MSIDANTWPEINRFDGIDTDGETHTIIVLGEPPTTVLTLSGPQIRGGYHRAYKTLGGLYLNPVDGSSEHPEEFAVLGSDKIIKKS